MLITTLQLNNVCVGGSLEQLLLVESFLCILVESLQVGDLRLSFKKIWKLVIELGNKHAELSAPVTDVVRAKDFVAQKLKNTAYTVTLNGRPQVAYMHIFSNVG
jgi:hypothetical protein